MIELPRSRTLDKFVVRLPDGLRDKLSKAAKANARTMNAEIVARLEASLARDDEEGVPDFTGAFDLAMVVEALKHLQTQVADVQSRLPRSDERL